MPVRAKKRPGVKRRPARPLPIPEAVGVRDGAGPVVAWDLRALHEFERELGRPSDCDADCLGRSCVTPLHDGTFRHFIGPGAVPGGRIDEGVVARWLADHPHPMIVLPGDMGGGCYEALPGWSVVDVVRAFVREAGRQ